MNAQELFDYIRYLRHTEGGPDLIKTVLETRLGGHSKVDWGVIYDLLYLSPTEVTTKYGLSVRVGVAEYVVPRDCVFSCIQCERTEYRRRAAYRRNVESLPR